MKSNLRCEPGDRPAREFAVATSEKARKSNIAMWTASASQANVCPEESAERRFEAELNVDTAANGGSFEQGVAGNAKSLALNSPAQLQKSSRRK